jgi:hypothetical protein
LKAKRAEIAGRIEHAQIALRQLVIDLDNIDAALRIFAPDIDLEDIRPKPMPPRNAVFRGEIARIILRALREAKQPKTSRDLAVEMMAARGLNCGDVRLVHIMTKRFGACLRDYRARGLVTDAPGPGALECGE